MSDPSYADATVAQRFEIAAAAHPDRLALAGGGRRMSYRELRLAAGGVARVLASLPPSTAPVLVLVHDDLAAPIAMLAAAMAGRPYLVLDPGAPAAFTEGIARRHGVAAVGTDALKASAAKAMGLAVPVIDVDATFPDDPPAAAVLPSTPLSVSTTSGSTGTPKSVVHPHRNVVHNAMTYAHAIGAASDDRFLVVTPFSGVSAATPTYTALLTGATLVVHPLPARSLASLGKVVADEAVTVAHLPPTVLAQLAEAGCGPLPGVRLVTIGGDRLLPSQARAAREVFPGADLLVRYNTSEANWIAGHRIASGEPLPDGPAPMGRPVPWKQVRIVDSEGAEVTPGDTGELIVSSDYLADGYLDDPELTAERFVVIDGARWYHTHDRVRQRADGLLEFAGREDHVIKVRGVLVDLDRVEQELAGLLGVRAVAVAAVEPGDAPTTLVALVVGDEVPPPALRRLLLDRLPQAMVPSRFVPAASIPLTSRGKVDRAAVAAMAAASVARPAGEPPREHRERVIADAFEAALGVSPIGRDDDIFELGADSLTVAELGSALTDHLGREVDARALAAHPTAASLAAALAEGQPAGRVVRVAAGDPGAMPLAMFSGAGGGHVDGMAMLARAIGRHPAYAIVPRGFDGRGRADRTVLARARRAADDIAEAGLASAVALVGYSSGGTVAMETARELSRRGLAAPPVILIDTAGMTEAALRRRSFGPNLVWQVRENARSRSGRGLRTTWAHRAWWAAGFTRVRVARRVSAVISGIRAGRGTDRHREFQDLIKVAVRRHVDTAYDGPVWLVRAERSYYLDVGTAEDLNWSEILGRGVPMSVVPGTHHDLLEGHRMATTGAGVRAALDALTG